MPSSLHQLPKCSLVACPEAQACHPPSRPPPAGDSAWRHRPAVLARGRLQTIVVDVLKDRGGIINSIRTLSQRSTAPGRLSRKPVQR
jgi:hypothetical protein